MQPWVPNSQRDKYVDYKIQGVITNSVPEIFIGTDFDFFATNFFKAAETHEYGQDRTRMIEMDYGRYGTLLLLLMLTIVDKDTPERHRQKLGQRGRQGGIGQE